MYAIIEANNNVVGVSRSADRHGGEYWTGCNWSPCGDQAKPFGSEAEAATYAEDNCGSREWRVVEIED